MPRLPVRMLLNAAIVLAALYGAALLLLYVMQSRLIYYPEVGRDVTTTPRAAGLDFEELWLDAGDGARLHGWFVGHARPKGAVLILHGNAGSIGLRLGWLSMFHALGYASLIIDYRGYGRSSGTPSESGTYEDARLAWLHLTRARGFAAHDIVLLGESLGGPIAAHLAASATPRALILHSTFTSLPDLAAQHYRFMPVRWLSRFEYDTRAYVTQVRCPVLVAHSPQDDLVPVRHGRALFEAAPGEKAFIALAGGHNDAFIYARRAWVEAAVQFLARYEAAPGL